MEENKKWMHKEIERERRQEMAKLYTTLRSFLPLEYIKGKRSISDHVYEAMNYINHLQNKVKHLEAKRDELMNMSNLNTFVPENDHNTHPPPFVIIQPFPGGLEIICSYNFKKYVFPFSRVLDMLLKEGVNVISYTSNKIDERFLHTIISEDIIHEEVTGIHYTELQRKLTETIASSSSMQETLYEPENC